MGSVKIRDYQECWESKIAESNVVDEWVFLSGPDDADLCNWAKGPAGDVCALI